MLKSMFTENTHAINIYKYSSHLLCVFKQIYDLELSGILFEPLWDFSLRRFQDEACNLEYRGLRRAQP
jgi:hypothetical protein